MAFVAQLTGKSKTGKTHSIKQLVVGEYSSLYKDAVYYINADQKPMAWTG